MYLDKKSLSVSLIIFVEFLDFLKFVSNLCILFISSSSEEYLEYQDKRSNVQQKVPVCAIELFKIACLRCQFSRFLHFRELRVKENDCNYIYYGNQKKEINCYPIDSQFKFEQEFYYCVHLFSCETQREKDQEYV